MMKTFFEKHPADAAQALEGLPHEEAIFVLKSISLESACAAIEYLAPSFASLVFSEFAPEEAKVFLAGISPKRAADILLALPEEKRNAFLSNLDSTLARTLSALLTYPPETAGVFASRHKRIFG
jgi:Mg/Co/Ni transporter MgtE